MINTLTTNQKKAMLIISNKFKSINAKAYIVGGSVRDYFIGEENHDIDIVVCGTDVNGVKKVFPDAIQTGNSFPVFRITLFNEEYEIALARTEKKTGKGHNGFSFDSSKDLTIIDDLFRRDVTMNAMAYDIDTKEFIDPYNAKSDIENKVIKKVSHHFSEDPIRVLRVARQAAKFGFTVDNDTLKAMEDTAVELKNEPVERIFEETRKALETNHPHVFFEVLYKGHCLNVTFPSLLNNFNKTINNIKAASSSNIETIFAVLVIYADINDFSYFPSKWIQAGKIAQELVKDNIDIIRTCKEINKLPDVDFELIAKIINKNLWWTNRQYIKTLLSLRPDNLLTLPPTERSKAITDLQQDWLADMTDLLKTV